MPIDDSEAINQPALAANVPQFSTAEYSHIPSSERCGICGNFVSGEYYRVNNQMACGTCALQARDGQPKDSHAAFVRGLALGAGAALVGLILYATFTIVTHFYFGYIALGVGWIVAKAIMKGSGGIGGRRYQIAAVLLTYAAISVAAVPIGISFAMKQRQTEVKRVQQQQAANPFPDDAKSGTQSSNDAQDQSQDQPQTQSAPGQQATATGVGAFLLRLLFLGLASPFLELRDPMHGAIGLFILFIGLRIAFQITRAKPLEVDGPYPVTA
jgi:hypothetical protein